MKCPDNEQLMLYAEGELDQNELTEIHSHLLTCKKCQKEVELFKYDLQNEILFRNKVDSSFQKRSVSKKIMEAIKAESRPISKAKSEKLPFWASFLLKFMVPALAIAIALFIYLVGSPSNNPVEVRGNIYRISVMANNSNDKCFVDDNPYTEKIPFDISSEKFKTLNGSFIVNVVTPKEFYSLKIDGVTKLKFDIASMTPLFSDCNANISIINGESAKLRINDDLLTITKKKPFTKKEQNNASETVKILNQEDKSKIKTVEITVATYTEVNHIMISSSSSIINNKKAQIIEEENENSTDKDNDSLTQNQTGGISIIESLSEKDYSETKSPFDEREIDAD